MSNIGLFYYNNVNAEEIETYIKKVLKDVLKRKPKCQIFEQYSKKELCGLINWGVYPTPYAKIENTHIFFDGYILGKDKEINDGAKFIGKLYNKYGINFVETIPFFGNIVIKTPKLVQIITPYHTLFDLYYHRSRNIFCVAPAIKFIFPVAKENHISLSKEAIAELLSLEHTLNRKTIYNKILKLDNLSIYTFNPKNNKLTHKFYKPHIDNKIVDYKTYLEDIEDLFLNAIDKVLNPVNKRYKISLCFSGGTDSSYLLAHLLRKGLKVTTYTHTTEDHAGHLINALKKNYPNVEIKLIGRERQKEKNFKKLTEKYEQLIDIQETKRLQGDLHLVDFHKSFDPSSIFTEGTVGDVIMADTKLDFLIGGSKNIFRKMELISSNFLPNEITLFLLRTFSSMVKPSDYYISKINRLNWPLNIVNNIKREIEYNYETIKGKYDSTDNIKQFERYVIENRMYGYMNDHCYVGRNYNEYFLSPFYENDFFNYALSIDYSTKFNAKLNYDLNKKDSYFRKVPIENTGKTIEKFFYKYRVDRKHPFGSLFESIVRHISPNQKTKSESKIDSRDEDYIKELLSNCDWEYLITESIFKDKTLEIYYVLLFEKKMEEYYNLYNGC